MSQFCYIKVGFKGVFITDMVEINIDMDRVFRFVCFWPFFKPIFHAQNALVIITCIIKDPNYLYCFSFIFCRIY